MAAALWGLSLRRRNANPELKVPRAQAAQGCSGVSSSVTAAGYISEYAGNRLREEKEKKDNYGGQT